jgi:hypothetical protein
MFSFCFLFDLFVFSGFCSFIDKDLASVDLQLRYQGAAKTLHELSAHIGPVTVQGVLFAGLRTERPEGREASSPIPE